MVGTILGMLGHQVSDASLKEIIDEVDADGKILTIIHGTYSRIAFEAFNQKERTFWDRHGSHNPGNAGISNISCHAQGIINVIYNSVH